MNQIAEETRRESNESVNKAVRNAQVLTILSFYPNSTAKEVAERMNARGWIPTTERNFAAPRLTELVEKGIVEVSGKKKDTATNKRVCTYRIKEVEA